MPTLRLTQSIASQPDHYRVEIALESDGIRQAVNVHFQFGLSEQDYADLRWYLEDYLQYTLNPGAKIAARVEGRMTEIGMKLFNAIFHADDDARDLWATLRHHLDETRVEVATDVLSATAIPWELIRDSKTDVPVALRAKAFVRGFFQPVQYPLNSQIFLHLIVGQFQYA